MIGSTALELARLVRSGATTAEEVVRTHLRHIEEVDDRVGAFQVLCADEAIAGARSLDDSDDLGDLPLAGVPVAVKDVIDVAGLPTRHGSAGTSEQPAAEDDPLIRRLREAGAVIVGKTRGPELSLWGASDNVFGVARNPWDLDRVSGGSSGGSAAAVAAGMVPVALGTDGLGSIRIPAASCGTFGIKPGSGVVPMRFGDEDRHWYGMTQYGALATTVTDAALFLDVLAGADNYRHLAPTEGGLRIAVSVASSGPGVVVRSETREAVIEAARVLRVNGHHVRRADPPYTTRAMLDILARWTQGAAQDVEVLGIDESRLEGRNQRHVAIGRAVRDRRPVDDDDAARWQARISEFFTEHDLLLCPTLPTTAIAHRDWHLRSWAANALVGLTLSGAYTAWWNFADTPAVSVPFGIAGDGLPLAIQLVGPHAHEERVLDVARQLEATRPWPRLAPGYLGSE